MIVNVSKCNVSHMLAQKNAKRIGRMLITCVKVVLPFREYTAGEINIKIPVTILN